MMLLDCPAYLDEDGTARRGLPAGVRCRFTGANARGPGRSGRTRETQASSGPRALARSARSGKAAGT